jgi:hypothetical protein
MPLKGETLQPQARVFSYNVHVTFEELRQAIGRMLRDVRERQEKSWFQLKTDAEKAGAKLDPKTMKAIERGDIGTLDKAHLLAQLLGLSIVDVLQAVLKASERPPTPEADALARCFEQLDVKDRRLLLESAQRLLEQHEALMRLQAQVAAAATKSPPKRGRRGKEPPSK